MNKIKVLPPVGHYKSFLFQVRHFYKKLYFNPGLYHVTHDQEETEVEVMSGNMDMDMMSLEQSVEEVRRMINNNKK